MRVGIFLASIMLIVSLLPSPVSNAMVCQCAEGILPTCAAYARADAVFVGTVTSVERSKEAPSKFINTFKVEESFRGIARQEAEILTADHMCGAQFKVGEKYLLYAARWGNSNKFVAGFCAGTKSFVGADEDLSYLRALVAGKTTTSVQGRVVERKYYPVQGLRITVVGNDKKYAAITDAEGRFNLRVATAGAYKVRAFSRRGIEFGGTYRSDAKYHRSQGRSVMEYDEDVPTGACSYTEFEVWVIGKQ